jgi:hypothetical protein
MKESVKTLFFYASKKTFKKTDLMLDFEEKDKYNGIISRNMYGT